MKQIVAVERGFYVILHSVSYSRFISYSKTFVCMCMCVNNCKYVSSIVSSLVLSVWLYPGKVVLSYCCCCNCFCFGLALIGPRRWDLSFTFG